MYNVLSTLLATGTDRTLPACIVLRVESTRVKDRLSTSSTICIHTCHMPLRPLVAKNKKIFDLEQLVGCQLSPLNVLLFLNHDFAPNRNVSPSASIAGCVGSNIQVHYIVVS